MAKAITVLHTSTGTGSSVDWTSTGIGTPDGAIVIIAGAVASNTDRAGISRTVAIWDGTNSPCIADAIEDGPSKADSEHTVNPVGPTGSFEIVTDAGVTDAIGTISNITDGIRVTFTNNPNVDYRATVYLFSGGLDVEAVLQDTSATVDGTASYTGWGGAAAPQVAFVFGSERSGGTGTGANALLSYGVAVNDGSQTQRCIAQHDANGTNEAVISSRASNVGCGAWYDGTNSAWYEITAFASNGYTITTRNYAHDKTHLVLLVGGLADFSLDDTAIPTSTGIKSWEGPGFEPGFLYSIQSGLEAYNTNYTTEDMVIAVGTYDGTTESCDSFYDEYNAAVMVVTSRASTTFLRSDAVDYADNFVAAFSSFDSLGYNINYTTIATGAQGDIGFTLALQVSDNSQTLLPTGIASTAAYGTPVVAGPIIATGIASTAALGSPQLNLKLEPTGIASTAALGTPQLDLKLEPTGIAPTAAFGTALLELFLEPTGIASTVAFGTAIVELASGEQFLEPTGIASTASFGTPVVAGPIIATGIASTAALGSPQLDLKLEPTGIASTAALGTPQLDLKLEPTGIASTEAFGTALLELFLEPTGIASTVAFGTASIAIVQYVEPAGIASTAAFGTAQLNQNIQATGIASTEALGTPQVNLNVHPTGIASTAALGTPSVSALLRPTGIASTAALGTPQLDLHIVATGIPSEINFGAPAIQPGPVTLEPSGIATTVSFGTSTLKLYVEPTSIASTVAFGAPHFAIEQFISPGGIASTLALGEPYILETATLGYIGYTAINLYPNVDVNTVTVIKAVDITAKNLYPNIDFTSIGLDV